MDFFEFLNESVTPYHTVLNLEKIFSPQKDIILFKRGGALIAVRGPQKFGKETKFRIALAHTDFPTLKITPNPDKEVAGIRTLHPEIYGSPIYSSWLDRDLGYAGLIAYEKKGKIETQIFRGKKLFRIPELPIHLNRDVNREGVKINPQNDLNVFWTSVTGTKTFEEVLKEELPKEGSLLDYDVQLFDAQPANYGGFENQWIYSGRLDNLSSCHAIAEAFAHAEPSDRDFQVAAFFNNEEVGSETREGAAGNFLKSVLEKVLMSESLESFPASFDKNFAERLSFSIVYSIDMAHACHSNFLDKYEPNHMPILGGGIVLKINSQKRYASDVYSSAHFKLNCRQNNIPYQTFVMRNDMPCGTTVGPIISASLGIPTVDIGEPMLSMHSIREMTAVEDHKSMIKLISALYR